MKTCDYLTPRTVSRQRYYYNAGPPVCRLKADSDHLKVEEDKLKVVWHAAAIEKWLVGRQRADLGDNH